MALKVLKIFICGLLLGSPLFLFVETLGYTADVQSCPLYSYGLGVMGFLLGAGLGRYISWGWLLGAIAGAVVGLYGPLLWLALLWNDRSYEDGLGYLLVGAGIGLFVGGYGLSAFIKRRANR